MEFNYFNLSNFFFIGPLILHLTSFFTFKIILCIISFISLALKTLSFCKISTSTPTENFLHFFQYYYIYQILTTSPIISLLDFYRFIKSPTFAELGKIKEKSFFNVRNGDGKFTRFSVEKYF